MSVSAVKGVCGIVAALVFAVPLELAAAPKVVYVVPGGAGEQTGVDWANAMASIGDAYASAAAFSEAGQDCGEVRVKTGYYFLPATIQLKSHVALRGGYAGESEMESADPEANLTILTGSKDGSAKWLIENDGTRSPCKVFTQDPLACNPPNPDHADDYWCAYGGNADTQRAFINTTDASLVGAEVEGFTIGCFYYRVLEVTAGTRLALTMRRCRMIGNTTARANWTTIVITDAGVALEECEFMGNFRPLQITANTADSYVIRNCRFYENRMGAVHLVPHTEASISLENCTFKWNHSDDYNYATAVKVAYPGNKVGGCVTVSNCLFEANRVRKGCNGTLMTSGSTKDPTIVKVVASRFIANDASKNLQSSKHSAAIFLDGIGKNIIVRDSYFSGNKVQYEAENHGCSSVLGVYASNIYPVLLNNTICSNEVHVSNASAFAATIANTDPNGRLGIVNCLFDQNLIDGAKESESAELVATSTCGANSSLRLIDSVLHNVSKDYVPIRVGNANVQPFICNNAISNFDPSQVAVTTFKYCGGNSTDDPMIRPGVKQGENGALAIGLEKKSPFAKGAHGVRFANSGAEAYFYDLNVLQPEWGTKRPWQGVATGTQYSEADGEAKGLTLAAPLECDALGAPRKAGRIPYGPLNSPTYGLSLLIR